MKTSALTPGYTLHTHHFVRGPRSSARYRGGVWCETKFTHSHEGGDVAHTHPETGPSFYAYRSPKRTKKPNGEQFAEMTPLTDEERTFEVVITDSALKSTHDGLVPIGDTPVEALGFPAADRMMVEGRMICVIRDERKGAVQA